MADLSATSPRQLDAAGSQAYDAGSEQFSGPVPTAPDHDIRAVLSIKPFRRLWLALGLSSFGDWLGLLAITALAGSLPQTPAAKLLAVSGVFILRLAPAVFFGPLAGVVADRLPRRWTLVYGDVLRFVLFCSIPLVGTLWWLYVATVLVEVVGLFWMPAKDASVPNLVPRRRLEAANQLSLIVTYGSAPLAALAFAGLTLLSGVLDNVVSHLRESPTYLALYVNALTFLVSALVIWRLELPQRTGPTARQESVWRTAVAGWTFIGRTPLVRGLVLGMLGAFAAGGFVIGLAQNFVGALGAGSPGYGTLFAAVFLGMALGAWLAPRLLCDFSRRRLFGLSIAAAGVWLVLLSLVPNMVLAVFFTLGLGSCAGAAWVTGYTLLGLEVGDDIRGRTFAFVQSMVRVVLISVLALGPIIAAGFSELLGLPHTVHVNKFVSLTYTGAMATFLLAGIIAVVIGVLSFRQIDDRPGVPLLGDLLAAVRQRQLQDAPARRPAYSGCFVAFEGADGAGKSTQVRLLGEWLVAQGYPVVLTHEPGATPLGAQLREVLLHGDDLAPRAEALLFAADRAHHVESVVRPALASGAVVVTDRYADSSIAYQGSGRDLGVTEIGQLSRWATQGLQPDLTIVLDVDPGTGQRRRQGPADRLESEPDPFHHRVRDRFLELARRAPSRYLVVEGALPPEQVHQHVVEQLSSVLGESPVALAEREQREAMERVEAEHVAAERAEAERVAAERLAVEHAEQERLAAEHAEQERLAAALRAQQHEDEVAAAAAERERWALARPAADATVTLPVSAPPSEATTSLPVVGEPVAPTAHLPAVTDPLPTRAARRAAEQRAQQQAQQQVQQQAQRQAQQRVQRQALPAADLEDEIFSLGEDDRP